MIRQVFIAVLLCGGIRPSEAAGLGATESIVGLYRCWSHNVAGRGGACGLTPALVLKADGTYQMSSEKGTYKVRDGKLILSKSELRGDGVLDGQGHIIFQYTYRGLKHRVTYLRSAAAAAASSGGAASSSAVGDGAVDMRIHFPASNKSTSWINTISLQEDGQTDRFDCLAHGDGKTYVDGYFRKIPRGRVYKVLVGSGFQTRQVGSLDLTGPAGDKKIVIDAE